MRPRITTGGVARIMSDKRIAANAGMQQALRKASAPVTQQRRQCPKCGRQIQTMSDRKTLRPHDDKVIDGALCDGSWKEA